MKTLITILTLITITTFSSCLMPGDDEPATLPPLTTEGKNTFGCLIDGRVFVPGKKELGAQILSIFFEQGSLQLQAKAGKESVSIKCNNVTSEGSYFIPPPPFDGKMYLNTDLSTRCWHRANPYTNAQIEVIYFDKSARIIAGTFDYMLVDSCHHDTIHISEGRFDVKF